MWYLASIFLITESMSNQDIINHFEYKLQENQCVLWKTNDMLINFCGGVKQVAETQQVHQIGGLESAVIFAMAIGAIFFLINEGGR